MSDPAWNSVAHEWPAGRGENTNAAPAGDFDTVKLVRHTYLGDGNSWHTPTLVISKEWYAPALGRSIRYETRAQYDELDSIDPTTDYGDWITYQLVSYQTP